MYCKFCGAELSEDAVFCTKCGGQIGELPSGCKSEVSEERPAASALNALEKSEIDGADVDDDLTPHMKTSAGSTRNESDGDGLPSDKIWPTIEPSGRRGVLEGAFKAARLGCGEDGLYLLEADGCIGLTLNCDTVAGFNPIGNLSENSDGSRDVVVRWKHGETSLMLMDEETLSILEKCCPRSTDLDRADVKEEASSGIVKALYIVAGLSIVPLTIWIYGTMPIFMLAAFFALFPWILCIAAAYVLGIIIEWYFGFQLDKRYFTVEERRERERQRFAFKQRNEAAKREREAARSARAKEAKRLEEQQRQSEIAKNLKCPICGSRDIERIGTGSRVASIAMVGIASGKVGKQYKCKYCKHMW